MRVRPDDMGMHQSRPAPLTAIRCRLANHLIAGHRIAAVDFLYVEARKSRDKLGNAAARGLDLDRYRNGVAVVFYQVEDRQLQVASSVQRLKELAFARRALACRNVDNPIRVITRDEALRITN